MDPLEILMKTLNPLLTTTLHQYTGTTFYTQSEHSLQPLDPIYPRLSFPMVHDSLG